MDECRCPICDYRPPCPRCGHSFELEPEPTEEELKEERRTDAWAKHEKTEFYREKWAEKKGYIFKPKPFVFEED